jgi:preprotein translocase subunit SecA
MIQKVLYKIIGTKNERELKRLQPRVEAINALEPQLRAASDVELRARTDVLRQRLAQGATLEEILEEAFATCREVARRVLNMRHFDVQLLGGMVLHRGTIAEMATGEGKTLVATLPVYLNALEGKGVHVVTVNDYLAKRDTQWMGPIYHALGLSIGVIQGDDPGQPRRVGQRLSFLFDPTYQSPDPRYRTLRPITRQEAYRADITYGTNNEFGFDYLRDNMVTDLTQMVQRPLHYAIVDEVDNILIDEARTPLIISGPSEESTELYAQIDRIIPRLKRAATIAGGKMYEVEATVEGDYIVDEKAKTVALTEQGVHKVEGFLSVPNLYDPSHITLVHHVQQALKAHTLFERDRDYVVQEGADEEGRSIKQVIIVDEFTGRLMPGRRWSDGLHQAVEAKEGVRIEQENQTLATITFQNYFRMYQKLAGMTGTAETEAEEFAKIYKLDVMVIPTNRTLIRVNHPDVVFKTEKEKYAAVVEEIAELHAQGRPVLVGTTSIEKSEKLSRLLHKHGVPHNVLNAKQHEREAEIVAQAGRVQAVTISTNMAGRGTDILLGGNAKFMAAELVRRGDLDKRLQHDPDYPAVRAELEQQQRYGLLEVPDLEAYALAMVQVRRQTQEEHDRVVGLGGLHILGTERHEARRIDNQLRGRAGRQGDPGSSRFYLSLEDDLMRLFVQDRMARIMEKLGMQEGEAIEHSMVTKAIATAQRRVEAHNFEIRKHLLEYDDVMNTQRQVIYGERRKILEGKDLRDHVLDVTADVVDGLLELYTNAEAHPEEWDLGGLTEGMKRQFGIEWAPPAGPLAELTQGGVREALWERVEATYAQKEVQVQGAAARLRETLVAPEGVDAQWLEKILAEAADGHAVMRWYERRVLLGVVDAQWKDHLLAMDHLKEGIGLRGYGQKDPLIEYKKEGFDLFEAMVERIKETSVERLFLVDPQRLPIQYLEEQLFFGPGLVVAAGPGPQAGPQPPRAAPKRPVGPVRPRPAAPALAPRKVGRNDPCPCGSGKKFKKCCGA